MALRRVLRRQVVVFTRRSVAILVADADTGYCGLTRRESSLVHRVPDARLTVRHPALAIPAAGCGDTGRERGPRPFPSSRTAGCGPACRVVWEGGRFVHVPPVLVERLVMEGDGKVRVVSPEAPNRTLAEPQRQYRGHAESVNA